MIELAPGTFSFGGALNTGAAAAVGDVHVALSSHCALPRRDWVERALGHYEQREVAGTHGCRHRPDRRPLEAVLLQDAAHARRHPYWGFSNHASSWRAEVWEQFRFDERLVGLRGQGVGAARARRRLAHRRRPRARRAQAAPAGGRRARPVPALASARARRWAASSSCPSAGRATSCARGGARSRSMGVRRCVTGSTTSARPRSRSLVGGAAGAWLRCWPACWCRCSTRSATSPGWSPTCSPSASTASSSSCSSTAARPTAPRTSSRPGGSATRACGCCTTRRA